jgi:hypothetical protein
MRLSSLLELTRSRRSLLFYNSPIRFGGAINLRIKLFPTKFNGSEQINNTNTNTNKNNNNITTNTNINSTTNTIIYYNNTNSNTYTNNNTNNNKNAQLH